jgi:hypothetical protein
MKLLCILLFVGAAALAPAQNGSEDRDAANARLLFEEGQQRLKLGNPGMAKVTFETLVAVYPESSFVSQAKEGIRTADEMEEQLPTVKSIRFLNFKKVKPQEVVERLRVREARLEVERPCDDRCIVEAQSIVNELLAEKGHAKARVHAEMRTVSPWSIEITFKLRKS